jgi:hypothetical protein
MQPTNPTWPCHDNSFVLRAIQETDKNVSQTGLYTGQHIAGSTREVLKNTSDVGHQVMANSDRNIDATVARVTEGNISNAKLITDASTANITATNAAGVAGIKATTDSGTVDITTTNQGFNALTAGVNSSIAGLTTLVASSNANLKGDITNVSGEVKDGTQNVITAGHASYAHLANNIAHLSADTLKGFGSLAVEVERSKFFNAEAERRTQLMIAEKACHSDLRNADFERRISEKTFALENEILKQFKYTDLQACHNTSNILQKLAECCCENKGLHKDSHIRNLQNQINVLIANNNNGNNGK